MRVLDAFGPRGATWSGQVISSPPGPSGGPSKTHLLPGGGVPWVHRARSPVLPRLPRFATPQSVHQFAAVAAGAYPPCCPPNAWSPGAPAPPGPCYWLVATGTPFQLARRLPSLGVGAWRAAPILPWGVQCPVRLCAAFAAGLGGSGRYLVLCSSGFPLPVPRVPRCLWRAVPFGCPLPSLAGTPFHAVSAFRVLGPVALLVVPACPLRVCALTLQGRPLPPPPWVVWRAHLARSRHWAMVGPFKVVRAPPRVLPRSLAPSGVLGGGRSGPGSPLLGFGLWGWRKGVPGGGAFHCCEGRLGSGAPPPLTARPPGRLLGSTTHVLWVRACGCGGPTLSPWPARPVGAACRGAGPWRSCAGGRARGGGVRRAPHLRGRGGPVGRGVALPRSVPLPSLGRQQSGCHWRLSVHGGRGPPYHSGSCSPAFTWRDLCGVLARWRGVACSPRFLWEPAAGAGGQATLRLLSWAGGGGTIPPASGGGGQGPHGLRAGGGGGGGGRAAASLIPLWAAARGSPSWSRSCRRRTPLRRARAVRVMGPSRGGGG